MKKFFFPIKKINATNTNCYDNSNDNQINPDQTTNINRFFFSKTLLQQPSSQLSLQSLLPGLVSQSLPGNLTQKVVCILQKRFPTVIKIVDEFQKRGVKVYIVGGFVRNVLIGKDNLGDCDLVTTLFGSQLEKFCKEVGVDIKSVSPRSNLYQVIKPKIASENENLLIEEKIDILAVGVKGEKYLKNNSNNKENEYSVLRKVLRKDALGRDFTFNALYLEVEQPKPTDKLESKKLEGFEELPKIILIDPLKCGLLHLNKRVLSIIRNYNYCKVYNNSQNKNESEYKTKLPNPNRFLEDPGRILRAIRFCFEGFVIDPQTQQDFYGAIYAMCCSKKFWDQCRCCLYIKSRLGQEILKLLTEGYGEKIWFFMYSQECYRLFLSFLFPETNFQDPFQNLLVVTCLKKIDADSIMRQNPEKAAMFLYAAFLWPAVAQQQQLLSNKNLYEAVYTITNQQTRNIFNPYAEPNEFAQKLCNIYSLCLKENTTLLSVNTANTNININLGTNINCDNDAKDNKSNNQTECNEFLNALLKVIDIVYPNSSNSHNEFLYKAQIEPDTPNNCNVNPISNEETTEDNVVKNKKNEKKRKKKKKKKKFVFEIKEPQEQLFGGNENYPLLLNIDNKEFDSGEKTSEKTKDIYNKTTKTECNNKLSDDGETLTDDIKFFDEKSAGVNKDLDVKCVKSSCNKDNQINIENLSKRLEEITQEYQIKKISFDALENEYNEVIKKKNKQRKNKGCENFYKALPSILSDIKEIQCYADKILKFLNNYLLQNKNENNNGDIKNIILIQEKFDKLFIEQNDVIEKIENTLGDLKKSKKEKTKNKKIRKNIKKEEINSENTEKSIKTIEQDDVIKKLRSKTAKKTSGGIKKYIKSLKEKSKSNTNVNNLTSEVFWNKFGAVIQNILNIFMVNGVSKRFFDEVHDCGVFYILPHIEYLKYPEKRQESYFYTQSFLNFIKAILKEKTKFKCLYDEKKYNIMFNQLGVVENKIKETTIEMRQDDKKTSVVYGSISQQINSDVDQEIKEKTNKETDGWSKKINFLSLTETTTDVLLKVDETINYSEKSKSVYYNKPSCCVNFSFSNYNSNNNNKNVTTQAAP